MYVCVHIYIYMYVYVHVCVYIYIYIYIYIVAIRSLPDVVGRGLSASCFHKHLCPVPLLRVWVSKGLTRADSEF